MRRFILNDDIYQASWCVQRGGTKRSALDWYCKLVKAPKLADEHIVTSEGAFYQAPGQKNGVIWIDDTRGAGTIVHEALHAALHLFDGLHVPMGVDTEEVLTYYVDWMVRSIIKRLWYNKKGKPIK